MRLSELIKIADNAYPDGLVGMAARGRRVGDTLAEFIAVELKETFDKDASTADQLAEAARAIGTAGREITAVHDALENAALDAAHHASWRIITRAGIRRRHLRTGSALSV